MPHTVLSSPAATVKRIKIGALEALDIRAPAYQAVVLLQGAQLIYFSSGKLSTKDFEQLAPQHVSDNWLWVSAQAQYDTQDSVRGGVPLCWPVFGLFSANPEAVKTSFKDSLYDVTQHGYARTQIFDFERFSSEIGDNNTSELVLTLTGSRSPKLDLTVTFSFNDQGVNIKLTTQNQEAHTVHFSQALHTYLPTADITQTVIGGFDGVNYSDTLQTDATNGGWQTKTQQGDISFEGEVDRIYHGAPDITLTTPTQRYQLIATGSNSTVVWNPWIKKAKQVSQFAEDDYLRMLCIETANAHLDAVTLQSGQTHSLSLSLSQAH